ncbi:MAG: flagellar basal-body rod protein FlgG [Pseudomonadota bacterium]
MKALAIAATGMSAQQTNLEVIANNVANINTTGFKRARAEFADLIYQTDRAGGTPVAEGELPVPEGVRIGLGVRTLAVRNLHEQGALAQTNNQLDLAINGEGWFEVQGPDGEELYTRAGAFNLGPNGEIITAQGYLVDSGFNVPPDATSITVNRAGEIFAARPGVVEAELVGQLSLAMFANPAGLEPLSDTLFRVTPASGDAEMSFPGEEGRGTINQGYLEGSNVDPVKEITELISAQRAYEMNSKVIQAADDMAGIVSQGIR